MSNQPSPHDAVFRRVLGEPANAASQLRAVLPAALVGRLDLDRLSRVSGSFVDSALRWRHSDLLFTVPLEDREAFVYVLVEHQSGADPLMAFRMLRYVVRIWDRYLGEHPEATRLPAVIPLVVHHNRRPWTGPTNVLDLVDLGLDSTAAEYLPRFRFLLDDLVSRTGTPCCRIWRPGGASRRCRRRPMAPHRPPPAPCEASTWTPTSAAEFRCGTLATLDERVLRARPLTPPARITLLLLKIAAGNPQLAENLREWTDELRAILDRSGGIDDFVTLLTYIENVGEAPAEELQQLFAHLGPEAEEAYVTTADMLRAEGEARGEARGRAEALVQLLVLKFGPLPQAALEAVHSASPDQLETWTARVLIAKTLDEVLY